MRFLKWTKRKAPSEIALHIIVSIIFMVVALSYIYVLVWAILAANKTHVEIVENPFSLPQNWHWEHFIEVTKMLEVNGNNFWNMLGNSVYFSVGGALATQFTSIALAYACSKYTFRGSGLIYTLVMVVITLPIYGTAGATYELYSRIGMIDSYAHILTCLGGFNLFFLYYMAFFKNLSWTYAEAAMMDGAGHFGIFYRVMLPQAKPIFGSLFLTQWISGWNNYESNLIYLPMLPSLPVGIYQFNKEMMYRARLDILFAACVLVTIPAIVIFIVFNKTITTSVSVGGIKG